MTDALLNVTPEDGATDNEFFRYSTSILKFAEITGDLCQASRVEQANALIHAAALMIARQPMEEVAISAKAFGDALTILAPRYAKAMQQVRESVAKAA